MIAFGGGSALDAGQEPSPSWPRTKTVPLFDFEDVGDQLDSAVDPEADGAGGGRPHHLRHRL